MNVCLRTHVIFPNTAAAEAAAVTSAAVAVFIFIVRQVMWMYHICGGLIRLVCSRCCSGKRVHSLPRGW